MLNRLHGYWILFSAACSIAILSVKALYLSMHGKLRRETFDKLMQSWGKKLIAQTRSELKVIHPERLEFEIGKKYLLISNHASLYDIPVIYAAIGGPIRMIAKKELSQIPLWGHAMKCAEVPFVDRKNRTQAIKDLNYAKYLMEDGIKIWIAPEGTRSRNGELGTFKKGAFVMAIETGATIVPIGIIGTRALLAAKSMQINMGQTINVNIGEPIDASRYSLEERDALLGLVRSSIETLCLNS